MSATYATALSAHDAGICVVPPAEDGTKRPITAWAAFQRQRPGPERLAAWYREEDRSGIGFVCGKVSGNLEVLEFDDHATYEAFTAAACQVGLGPVVERIEAGYASASPGGGIHWLYRCSEISKNTKLARRPRMGTINVLIETRGEGGYTIEPPTNGRVHPSGGTYRQIRGGITTIATITPAERNDVFALARSFDEMPIDPPRQQPHPTTSGGRTRPGDLFNQQTTWRELLGQHGWRTVYERNPTTYWRRPGKDHGISATTNHAGSDLLWVFSTSTPFEAERSYDKFGAFAVLDHGGDFTSAARAIGCDTGLGAAGVTTNGDATAAGAGIPERFNLTDYGNAERFVARHRGNVRYCYAWRSWLVWDGRRWKIDDGGGVRRLAKETVRSIYGEAAAVDDPKERAAIAKHALKSEAAQRVEALLALAQSEPGIEVVPTELDHDPWLLTVKNGTLDLRAGTLRPHEPGDNITKLAPVTYDPAASCPAWEAFLDRIMDRNDGLISFLQRAVGYSLTGDTSERAFFILHGEGRNGKSTFLETVRAVLGDDYADRTRTETLLARRDNDIPNDIARLRGLRFVTASEADEGRRLAEASIKDLTGGDAISARFMRAEWFTFRPEFKLWLGTNHKPVVRGTDAAIWDRIRLVPFAVRIPEAEQDKHLRDKLIADAPGILSWAIEGCIGWQREGLGEPPEVRAATEGYRGEMDILGGFLADCCVLRPTAKATAKSLYAAYVQWCDENGERPMSKTMVGKSLAERGFDKARLGSSGAWHWVGIGLIADDGPDAAHASAGRTEHAPDVADQSALDGFASASQIGSCRGCGATTDGDHYCGHCT